MDTCSSRYEGSASPTAAAHCWNQPRPRARGKDAPGTQGDFRLFTANKRVAAQETSLAPVLPLCPRPLHLHPGWDAARRGDALGRDTDRGSRFLTLLTVGSGNKCSQERWSQGSASVLLVLVQARRAPLPQGHQASRVIAWATQRDHKDRDVIAGAQLVIGQPPSPLLQHPPRPHHQLLGHHGVPGGHSTPWLSSDPDPTDSLTQHPAVPGKEEAGGARKGSWGNGLNSDMHIQGSIGHCGAIAPALRDAWP